MGCDIHFYVERKADDGVWESNDTWTPEEYAEEGVQPRLTVDYKNRLYHDRNYDLFAILAGVRNGRGFAGCDMGDGFNPISDPRGLPQDVSALLKAESDNYGSDGHSHSWFTVNELLAYDWTQKTNLRGVVSGFEYWEWNRWRREDGESPESYCGDVSGSLVRRVTESEMKSLLEPFSKEDYRVASERIKNELSQTYCQVQWEQPYYKCVRRFWSDVIPRLLRLGNPEDVRVVFWFDN